MATATGSLLSEVSSREEFQQQVLEAKVPVLVDFWAVWCSPCRAQLPIVEQLAVQAGERARVVKVNVDDTPELAVQYQVSSIPTLLVFEQGQLKERLVGVQSARTLAAALGL